LNIKSHPIPGWLFLFINQPQKQGLIKGDDRFQ